MWISRVTFCARRNTYHFVCFNRLISIWLYVTIFWWDHEYHVHIWNCFLFFSLSLSRFRCKLWPLACNVMWCREEFLVFFVCFVWIPLKSDFVVCILFSFVVCWCVPVFVEEMMHIKCAIHFHYAVVLMADSFLFFFFIFFPIINVMGFHCYCHSLAAVQLYLMIVIIGSRNSGRVDIFSQTNLRNVYHLTRKIKKTTNELNSGKMILFP